MPPLIAQDTEQRRVIAEDVCYFSRPECYGMMAQEPKRPRQREGQNG
jgi:hypothetical protein